MLFDDCSGGSWDGTKFYQYLPIVSVLSLSWRSQASMFAWSSESLSNAYGKEKKKHSHQITNLIKLHWFRIMFIETSFCRFSAVQVFLISLKHDNSWSHSLNTLHSRTRTCIKIQLNSFPFNCKLLKTFNKFTIKNLKHDCWCNSYQYTI